MNKSDQQEYHALHLGHKSSDPISEVDLIPWTGGEIEITLACNEFTSLCPVTHQPDFGELVITYMPDRHLVETKSLKLYLLQYRDQGVFSEALVAHIADDLFAQLAPRWMEVKGCFNSRGGIALEARTRREQPA